MSNPMEDQPLVEAVIATIEYLKADPQISKRFTARFDLIVEQQAIGNTHLSEGDFNWVIDRLYDNRKTCGLNRMLSPYCTDARSHRSAIREVVRHYVTMLAAATPERVLELAAS